MRCMYGAQVASVVVAVPKAGDQQKAGQRQQEKPAIVKKLKSESYYRGRGNLDRFGNSFFALQIHEATPFRA